ncbi:PfkB family carbohydrate kinase [Leucobacter sp. wl10]|uniref:PfkB family carbohydrate kinase n=1 Tax=Leucobacter sp. wl10 TaxID=2304677 RepID=UPI000E5A65F7|nr:PfkB family carbohydrate kinase [Leucobacter sp. wl10]RGE21960.1 sugar kinase [Leucobacter sp. wl10]
MRILGLGDNIVDRFLDRGTDYPGGNAVNVAVHAHRLGAESGYLGVFGDDEAGDFLRRAVAAEGVDLGRSIVREGESGVTSLHVVDGDRTFLGWNGGGVTVREPIDLDDGRLDYVAGFDLVHTSVYSGILPELSRLAGLQTLVGFDFSSEPEHRTEGYFARVAPHIDLALISCSEQSEAETHAILDSLISHGAALALATRGTDGAVVADGAHRVSEPALLIENPTSIVDTMGCGDAFVTGFIVHLLGIGWSRDRSPSAEELRDALRAGASASRDQCFVEAAFGRGRATPAEPAASEPRTPEPTL